jgi:uncharacterized membrane protein (UPF0127 family)
MRHPNDPRNPGARTPRRPWPWFGLAATALIAATGCTQPAPPQATVTIDDDLRLSVEIATSPDQQRTGLAGRDGLEPGTGMLFPFEPPGPRRVWMAGMLFPIDIAWIRDGRTVAVDTLAPCTAPVEDDCPRWASPGDVDALLEAEAGTLHRIDPGTIIVIEAQ